MRKILEEAEMDPEKILSGAGELRKSKFKSEVREAKNHVFANFQTWK